MARCGELTNSLGLHADVNGVEWAELCRPLGRSAVTTPAGGGGGGDCDDDDGDDGTRESECDFGPCGCGRSFPDVIARDRHVLGNREPSYHGPTPDELMKTGCAVVLVDTVKGLVLSARAIELPSMGHAKETSSRAESIGLIQSALELIRLVEAGVISSGTETLFFTDCSDVVSMMASQVKAKVSITKQAKSSLKTHAHDMHRIHDYLKDVYGMTMDVDTRHCKHERDRE